MFAPRNLYSQPQYVDLAALAEARAAEAAAKAAEAEYLAREAEIRARSRVPFWGSTPPSVRYSSKFSCACADSAEPEQSMYGYSSPYYQEHYPSRALDGFDGYSRPQRIHHFHHEPHHHPGRHAQRTLAELELENQLRKERIARLHLEEEINRLKAREQRLSQLPLGDFTNKRPAQCKPKAVREDDSMLQALFGRQYAEPSGHVRPQPRPKTTKSPQPYMTQVTPEDVIYDMILQNLNVECSRKSSCEKERPAAKPVPKKPVVPKEVSQQHQLQSEKVARKGSLVEQLKARYEQEGQDEIRDTIQSIVTSLLTPTNQQPKRPSPSTPATTPALSNALRATPDSQDGFDIIEAILGNVTSLNQPSHLRTASSWPTQPSSFGYSPAKAAATAAPTNTKGKEKENVAPAPDATASGPTSKDVVNAMKKVDRIEHIFHSLEADFTFPTQLDFAASSAPSSPTSDASAIFPNLAFTARNHPVRYYEQTLSSLLQELDLIESHGNSAVRMRRKRTVIIIENALEELEREVAGRWKASVANQESENPSPTPAFEVEAQRELETSKPVRIPIVDGESSPKEVEAAAVAPEQASEEVTTSIEETLVPSASEVPVGWPADLEPEASEHVAPVDEFSVKAQAAEATVPVEEATVVEHSSMEEALPAPEISLAVDLELTEVERETESPTPGSQADEETSNTHYQPFFPEEETPAAADITTPVISSPSPSSPEVIVEDTPRVSSSSDDESDGFLISQPSPLELEQRELKAKKRRSVEIEDLGSDWEDVDEA